MIYRNQTNTITQITMMSHMKITTPQEAVAFLRAIQPLQEQVAFVLQRKSITDQQVVNRAQVVATPVETASEPTPIPEPEKPFEAEDLSTDEGYSDKEIEEKVEKLKKAKKE